MTPELTAAEATARIAAMTGGGKRCIVGIAGAPGSGKSTLAEHVAAQLADRSVVVPMDGFHLATSELARLGRADRKGAEDTFDSAGYLALLRRLRDQQRDEIVYAPEFRRAIEEPIAGAIPVFFDRRLILSEGNYLLLDRGHWSAVRSLLDEAWFVDVEPALRLRRLIARHMHFGRDESAARAWVAQTDEPNAILIEATRARADFVVRID